MLVPLTPEEMIECEAQGKEDQDMEEDIWRQHSKNMNNVNFKWKKTANDR